MVKAILYDYDGTLADTFSHHIASYREALESCGVNATDDEIIAGCFNKLDEEAAANFHITDAEKFSRIYREQVKTVLQKAVLYPGALETVRELSGRGILLGIGTARHREEIDPPLLKLGIGEYFDCVITHDEVQKKKPDPEIFYALCEKLGVSSDEVLIVGDADVDLIAARAMNAPSVLYYPEVHEKIYARDVLMEHKPTHTIREHTEIINLL